MKKLKCATAKKTFKMAAFAGTENRKERQTAHQEEPPKP